MSTKEEANTIYDCVVSETQNVGMQILKKLKILLQIITV
jgi:hypothetical protein